MYIMDTGALLEATTRLKQGLLAKATDGEYLDKDYRKDIADLSADKRIAKILPASVRTNKSTKDFRREIQSKFNNFLREDGYEIYGSDRISGYSVYSYKYCM